MKYILFVWLFCLSNCYAQTTSKNFGSENFLYTSSLNEVNTLWNELSFVSKSSIMPKDISEQWGNLEKLHNHTSSIVYLVMNDSNQKELILTLTKESLMPDYNLLSKQLSAGIDWKLDTLLHSGMGMGIIFPLVLLQNEKTILYNVKRKLEAYILDPHLIQYSVVSATQYVSEIDWYVATITIQSFGLDLSNVKVIVNNVELPLVNGVAELKFKPSIEGGEQVGYTAVYQKKWNGKISIEYGSILEFPIEQIYYVGKTYAYLQGASVNALYEGCGNEVNFSIAGLGVAYAPRFEISNPEKNSIEVLKAPGNVVIIPTERKVEIKLYNDSIFIESFIFKVRFVPAPVLLFTIRGKTLDGFTVVRKELLLDKPVLKLKADESFSQFLPKDSRYLMKEYTVSVFRGGKVIREEKFKLNDSGIDFKLPSSIYKMLQSGDSIKIEVAKLTRITFEGKEVEYISKINPFVKFDIE